MITENKIDSSKNSLKHNLLFQVILPLILGTCIYIFFRPTQTVAESFLSWNFVPLFDLNKYWLGRVILGSLPDFLWLFSLLTLVRMIWVTKENIPLVLTIILYITPILSEVLQYFKVISGTGDLFDVLAYLIAISIFHNNFSTKNQIQ